MVTREAFGLLMVVLGAGAAGCSSDDPAGAGTQPGTENAPVACDPLAPSPLTLGAAIGVGSDGEGTSYVDAANGVFVTAGAALERRHVTGTGQSSSNEYLFSIEPPNDPAAAQTLLVETDDSGGATQMALAPAGFRQFLDQKPTGVTLLSLVDPASVSGLPVLNTPNEISYLADVENGDVILATTPMDLDPASQTGNLTLFYGPPADVEERTITAFEQSLSNEGTVTFLVGKDSYVLAFGRAPRSDNPLGGFVLKSLTPGTGTPLAVTLRSPTPSELPSDLAFSCLR